MITLVDAMLRRKNLPEADYRRLLGMICGGVGIFLNVLLFAGKLRAGLLSGSVAVTADAFNNLSDAGSSVISLLGFRLAGQKPDTEHPFGHGRMEYISGLFVAMAIILMGYELVKSSFDAILHPKDSVFSMISVAVLAAAILIKLYMFWYNRSIGRKIDSPALEAAATDSLGDCVSTSLVLVQLIVSRLFDWRIDGYCGMLVALMILLAGVKVARETISPLLGKAPEKSFVDAIAEVTTGHDIVVGMHDLVVHDYGPGRQMVSLHVEVPGNGDIYEMHDKIDHIEKELERKLGCPTVIHMDPVDTDDERVSRTRALVSALIKGIDERLSIHDFRIVPGPTHSNLIFDLVVPHDTGLSLNECRENAERLIREQDKTWYAVINAEHSYV